MVEREQIIINKSKKIKLETKRKMSVKKAILKEKLLTEHFIKEQFSLYFLGF